MSPNEVLAGYERLLAVTEGMLDAARQGHWDELVELERQRATALQELGSVELERLAAGIRDRLAAMMRAMLGLDRETRELTAAYRDDLASLWSSTQTEKKLRDAYGAGM